MADDKIFQWTYEQSQFDSTGDQFSTFSIGIFQWLPKASGKGLKKSKTIRVKGYVIEAQKAYKKADEVCQRLNKEKVKFENKPSWVKNQFSVPRPALIPSKAEIKKDSPYINASQFRSVRKRVMKNILEPLGYDVTSSVIAKFKNESILLIIEFQAALKSSNYIINLGLHYTNVESNAAIMPTRTGILDFACDYIFNKRIQDNNNWFNYTESKKEAEIQLISQLKLSLQNLDQLIKAYPTAQSLVDEFSAKSLIGRNSLTTKINGFSLSTRDLAFILADYCSKKHLVEETISYVHACKTHLGNVSKGYEKYLEIWLNKIELRIK
ncbi:MAG: hypothetical protein NE328_24370 [Lentisphaeraceae bacterium]|nr:hypothetical protein [Lentisphaeraceae bacterium]